MADVEAQQASAAAPASDPAPFVTGSISLPSAEENTLDEPVSATIHAEHDGSCAPVCDGVHRRVRRGLGGRGHRHDQRAAARKHHLILPERVRTGLLRVPAEYCDAALHGAQRRGLARGATDVHRWRRLCLVYESVRGVHVEARAAQAQGAHRVPRAPLLPVH